MSDANGRTPIRIINSAAPIRICDNGGWTDTWFAGHGKIFNIGVYPYAEVQIQVYPYGGASNRGGNSRIVIHAENYGDHYTRDLGKPEWDRHPLLEAAIERMRIPDDVALEVTIYSQAPGGMGTGTSAAVAVALVGALDRLTPGQLTPHEVAYTAQAIETDMLKQQCGIQDQLCSAYGGICYIEMWQYPRAVVSPIHVPDSIWWELERRLALVFLGKPHSSSQVHDLVIRELQDAGPDCQKIDDLRQTAERSRDAVYAGDLDALGRAMKDNTEAQARLHPELVSKDAQHVIKIAQAHGAVGWKVNGAGGEGGSITLLCGSLSHAKRALLREVEQANPLFKNIPIYLSRHGLRVWEQ